MNIENMKIENHQQQKSIIKHNIYEMILIICICHFHLFFDLGFQNVTASIIYRKVFIVFFSVHHVRLKSVFDFFLDEKKKNKRNAHQEMSKSMTDFIMNIVSLTS